MVRHSDKWHLENPASVSLMLWAKSIHATQCLLRKWHQSWVDKLLPLHTKHTVTPSETSLHHHVMQISTGVECLKYMALNFNTKSGVCITSESLGCTLWHWCQNLKHGRKLGIKVFKDYIVEPTVEQTPLFWEGTYLKWELCSERKKKKMDLRIVNFHEM